MELDLVPVTALVIAVMGQLLIARRTTIILQQGIQTNLLPGIFFFKLINLILVAIIISIKYIRSPVHGSSYGYAAWAGNSSPAESQATYEARVEDGKLFYEKRWYHRGQTVQVEGKKARFAGVISSIGTDAVILYLNQN